MNLVFLALYLFMLVFNWLLDCQMGAKRLQLSFYPPNHLRSEMSRLSSRLKKDAPLPDAQPAGFRHQSLHHDKLDIAIRLSWAFIATLETGCAARYHAAFVPRSSHRDSHSARRATGLTASGTGSSLRRHVCVFGRGAEMQQVAPRHACCNPGQLLICSQHDWNARRCHRQT